MRDKMQLNIYQYASFKEFLTSYYQIKKGEGYGHFNLNSWAKDIGYKSPRIISMVMKGQRAPSLQFEEKLSTYFSLSGNKKKYFEILRKKAILEYRGQETSDIDDILKKIKPHNLEPVDNLQFSLISEWQHLVIKQLVRLKGFKNDTKWISKKLKGKISPTKVEKSLELLSKLGHIKRKNNSFEYGNSIKAGNNIPSLAIKKYHEQMLERAKESLYEDSVDERFLYSISMNFDRYDIDEAKKMINDFLNDFDARFSPDEKNKVKDIYQIGIQFFPHTKKERVLH